MVLKSPSENGKVLRTLQYLRNEFKVPGKCNNLKVKQRSTAPLCCLLWILVQTFNLSSNHLCPPFTSGNQNFWWQVFLYTWIHIRLKTKKEIIQLKNSEENFVLWKPYSWKRLSFIIVLKLSIQLERVSMCLWRLLFTCSIFVKIGASWVPEDSLKLLMVKSANKMKRTLHRKLGFCIYLLPRKNHAELQVALPFCFIVFLKTAECFFFFFWWSFAIDHYYHL